METFGRKRGAVGKPRHSVVAREESLRDLWHKRFCGMDDRPHYNRQTWQEGRNRARQVPATETQFLKEVIEGYHRFIKGAEHDADEVINQTRKERAHAFSKKEAQYRKIDS